MNGESTENVVVVIGVSIEPLPGSAITNETAAAALTSSLPKNVSWEGNLMLVTDSWPVTVDMMKEVLRNDGSDRDHGNAEDKDTSVSGSAEGSADQPDTDVSNREAQSGQRRDIGRNPGSGSDHRRGRNRGTAGEAPEVQSDDGNA